jgi:hypothetical protein
MTATADSRINKRICAVIRILNSDCLIVGPLFPRSVSKRCPAIIFAVNRTARVPGLITEVLNTWTIYRRAKEEWSIF